MFVRRISHHEARSIISEAFWKLFGRVPSRAEAQCAQAIAWLETEYGTTWQQAGRGSNNWGAIAAPRSWTGRSFVHRDSTLRWDRSRIWHSTTFKAYASPEEGAEDLVYNLYLAKVAFGTIALDRMKIVLPWAQTGATLLLSAALHDTGFYAGFGATREQRIDAHHLKFFDACTRIAHALGERMPDGSKPPLEPPRSLRLTLPRMVGNDVREVQQIVSAEADGIYGKKTKRAVVRWQYQHGIRPDGIWGPVSRDAAEAASACPTRVGLQHTEQQREAK